MKNPYQLVARALSERMSLAIVQAGSGEGLAVVQTRSKLSA